jgi:hypothetical protein
MNSTDTVGEACFIENIRLFGNEQKEPEQFNLYNGLRVMSVAITSLSKAVEDVQRQCGSIAQQLHQVNRKMDELSRSR